MTDAYTLTARWIFPVDQAPLAHGTITIRGDRIQSVDKAGTRGADRDLGNVAILPGFVNAHTHLDLSDALDQCPPTPDFTAWLRCVIAHRRRQSAADVANAIDIGLSQCLRYGTTLLGDIAAGGASWEQVAQAPLRAVVFHELLGVKRQRANAALAQALAWLDARLPAPTLRPGLSPHAPYSVRTDLCADASTWASRRRLPLAIHLGESAAEVEFLGMGRGPFVEFLQELDAWEPSAHARSLDAVIKLCRAQGTLFVHGNYLPVSARVPRRSSIIYCPRTHARFGHAPHPFRAFLERGIHVALGTDSLASNPDLDMLAEARFLREKHPDLDGATLLRMATLHGAESLRWQKETGSLTPGKSADLVILPLPDIETGDPHALLLESSLAVKEVMFRGEAQMS